MTVARRGPSVARPDAGAVADVRVLAALLTGGAARPADADGWARVVALAGRECCGPLLWMRARDEVQAFAPASAVAELRAHAIAQGMRLRRRLERAAEMRDVLVRAGVPFGIWKGMALAALAHGDPYVRPSADVDLWVPVEARAAARAALEAAGWACTEGQAPWEEAFGRAFGAERERLELHSHLQGDMLAHLPSWPVELRPVTLDGLTLPAVQGASLALSLAIHHARHRATPLLWAADLRAVLAQVPADEVNALARRTRTAGYLAHARRVVDALEQIGHAQGTSVAPLARVLGFGGARRDNGHPARRDFAAAATGRDGVRVALAWLAPPRVRVDGGLLRGSLRRLGRMLPARALPSEAPVASPVASAPGAPGAPVHVLAVDRDDLETMLRAVVVEQGGAMWLRARGRSMHPTIRDGQLVRLVPTGDGPLARGRVVLARLGDGSWALHRVVQETAAGVALQGDATVAPDPMVPRHAVLAAADATAGDDGAPRPIAARAPWTLTRLMRPARLTYWRLRGRVRARRARAARRVNESTCAS